LAKRQHIMQTLAFTRALIEGGGAAARLGLNPSTLRTRMHKQGITRAAASTSTFASRNPTRRRRLLDREQRDIQSSATYMLAKVAESAVGGYRSIDPADSGATAAAEYAFSEQASRAGTVLVLRRIVRAERQMVAGVNYLLCLEVAVAGQPQEVRAIVFRSLPQQMSLTEWSKQGCQ
jgi:hypothetical protein